MNCGTLVPVSFLEFASPIHRVLQWKATTPVAVTRGATDTFPKILRRFGGSEQKMGTESVPISVLEWLPGQDSNLPPADLARRRSPGSERPVLFQQCKNPARLEQIEELGRQSGRCERCAARRIEYRRGVEIDFCKVACFISVIDIRYD